MEKSVGTGNLKCKIFYANNISYLPNYSIEAFQYIRYLVIFAQELLLQINPLKVDFL